MTDRVQFTIRDAAGVVVRTGMCGRDDLALQAREGETVEEGHAEQIEVPEILPLERVKARAVARVNDAASSLRGQHITVIPGQEMIYLAKEAEAVRYLASKDVGQRAPSRRLFAILAILTVLDWLPPRTW